MATKSCSCSDGSANFTGYSDYHLTGMKTDVQTDRARRGGNRKAASVPLWHSSGTYMAASIPPSGQRNGAVASREGFALPMARRSLRHISWQLMRGAQGGSTWKFIVPFQTRVAAAILAPSIGDWRTVWVLVNNQQCDA